MAVDPVKLHDRLAAMTFASVYPMYVDKVERKGRTLEELHTVIAWLTGYDDAGIAECVADGRTFEQLFDKAPAMNPDASLITGVICGYRVEEITDPLHQKMRWLDKLVDELARGKKLTSILRG
ncbi:conserved hypothetical protein [Xylanimonas cellulosilytica DSM 15894]|uniref:DUF2200 domain-containing protein n=1 Tax=Xylanimonas cellulosilytica (strain DSM 15894 / JCM 12276 / CECT 5975 / KCTC 9989 / LMG 20990 / NBRC 107835 / XIL07) TaxID=446471 RepID=D1BS49_XYLCX|nr:DUF2200 domain-containing protein [Xylanimonas cellulosilytica]ACZ30541.1 conserved hypothetical protein [Xylanimonas cellulosilytica DSM 15894]